MFELFNFLKKYSHIFLFLALESFALVMVFNGNAYQRLQLLSYSHTMVAPVLDVWHSVTGYFYLKSNNEALVRQNAELLNNAEANFRARAARLTATQDTPYEQLFEYIPAEVINNSITSSQNYLILNVGRKQGINIDMGVIAPDGVVGVVSRVSDNYCLVVSMLNIDFAVNTCLKNNNGVGNIKWPGENVRYGELNDIPAHVPLAKGDTIVTSGYSTSFPKGVPVACVKDFKVNPDNFYEIKAEYAVDYATLKEVFVLNNFNKQEIDSLKTFMRQ